MLHDVRRCDQHHVQSREQIRPRQREVRLSRVPPGQPSKVTAEANRTNLWRLGILLRAKYSVGKRSTISLIYS